MGAFFFLFSLASCRTAPPSFLTPEEQLWLEAHKQQLVVLFEKGLPPYIIHEKPGEYDGIVVDYLREIENKLGLRFTIREFDQFGKLLTYAENNRNFIIIGVNFTDERSRYLLFTAPIIKVPYAIVTRKTSQAGSIPELSGKTLCTVAHYAINEDMKSYYPHITPTHIENNIKGLHAVSSGTCDALIINQIEASYLIDKLGLANLQIGGQTPFLNRLAAATSHRDTMLFHILDKTMDSIKPSRRQLIYRRWVTPGITRVPHALLIALQVGGGAVLFIIILLWAWTTSLRQRVSAATRQSRETSENLRITLNSIGEGVMATDTTGKITRMNPVAVALTGWSQPETEGKTLGEVFKLKDIHTHRPIVPPDLTTCEKNDKGAETSEAILVSRTEEEYRIHYNVSPIRDEVFNTTGTVLVFRDVTDKIKTEEERMRFKKMESMGILAGGIAHDFNNFLTGLYGNISMAKMTLPNGHEAMGYLTSAEESMEDAVALTGQFLTFSKDEKPVREIIDLGKTLTEAASFATHGLTTGLDLIIAENLWPVSADKGQLSQVISNLLINAHQAMKTGGVTTLTATNRPEPSGRKVRITVRDTGTGIPPENLDKIFDPYFTTKKTGTGLGLATTYAIITNHGGTITVTSIPKKGTTFTIDLPASPEPLAAPSEEKPEALMDTHALHAHILVLDDQAVIRKILQTILTKLGLEVTFTVEGSETVETYRKRLEEGRPFDAVILDLTIPGGMGGREASEKILALDPDARLIISSGHAADPIMSNYEEYGIKAIAVKPYRFSDFKDTLLRVLLDK